MAKGGTVVDAEYCYPPDYTVLRNKFGIKDEKKLDEVEKEMVDARSFEASQVVGHFNLAHLCEIHKTLFQDVYEWAGEPRTIDISKNQQDFVPANFIEAAMDEVHRNLVERNFLCGLAEDSFVENAAFFIGKINEVHPFREGNGRTQLLYLKQLSKEAGHEVDIERLQGHGRPKWVEASVRSYYGDYSVMEKCIRGAFMDRDRGRERGARKGRDDDFER